MVPKDYGYLELKRIKNSEGYVKNGRYHYYRCDHLGSNREVWQTDGTNITTLQRTQYYPSGLPWAEGEGASEQPDKYTGKEFIEMIGYDMYDSQARMFDPLIGRPPTMDPLAEKYYSISPYAWCLNNPVRFVDPDGRKVEFAPGVSKEFKGHFSSAVQYLNENKASNMLYELHQSDKVYYVTESTGEGSSYNTKTNTISWNPLGGVFTNNGHELSPTTVLNHEIDHALQHDKNPEQMKRDAKRDGSQYGSKEEERVITGSEQTTAKKLGEIKEGEITRNDHGGVIYKTTGPTTTEWANPITIKPKKDNE